MVTRILFSFAARRSARRRLGPAWAHGSPELRDRVAAATPQGAARRIGRPETSRLGNLDRLDLIIRDHGVSVGKACADVGGLELRVVVQNGLDRLALRQQA